MGSTKRTTIESAYCWRCGTRKRIFGSEPCERCSKKIEDVFKGSHNRG